MQARHSFDLRKFGLHGKARPSRNDGWNPTRGIASPALASFALDGLERLLKEKYSGNTSQVQSIESSPPE